MSLARRANAALITKLFSAGLTYGFTLVLARWMEPEGFGQVAFFMTAAFLCAVLGAAGQQIALLRFLPGLVHCGTVDMFRATLRAAARRASFATGAVFIGFLGCLAVLRALGALDGFSPLSLFLGACLIPAMGLVDFQAHLARALNRIQLSLWPKEILWRGGALMLIAAWLALSGAAAPSAPQVLAVLGMVLLALAVFTHLRLALPVRRTKAGNPPPHADWAASCTPFWVSSVANVFLANADVMAVGILLGAAETGGYFLANRLAVLLAFFMVAHNVVIAPVISARWASQNTDQISEIARRAAIRITVPSAAVAVVLIALAEPILALFGPGYVAAAPALWLLVLAGLVNAAGGPSDIVLNLCGQERIAMRIAALILVASALLIMILGLLMGAIGVALAVCISMCLRKALFAAALSRHLHMRVDILAPLSPATPPQELRA